MYILRLCLSNCPRQIPSEGRFLLATGYWSLATVFIAILLSSGCADETINDPISENPVEDSNREEIVSTTANYFPMTVGSRWVYRNPDGSEWSREVTETEEVGTRNYHLFNYDPPIEDNQFPFFRAPMYITTLNSVVLKVKNSDINDAIRQIILESNDNLPGWTWVQKFQNGEWKTRKKGLTFLYHYNTSGVLRNDSGFLLRLPLVPGQTWEMLTFRLSGSTPIGFMHHTFESDVEILGTVEGSYSVPTPAGIFEDCLNIQYGAKPPTVKSKEFTDQTEAPENVKVKRRKHMEAEIRSELTTLLTHMLPRLGLESMWLAPGVGPVKIEGAEGRAILIDYEIK
ncbi:MAG: hypothetical protein OXN17_13420 [Candidatus Poribacteria bacterium]|nr:hypothetical protein [Candidatus Poribacteria bacterium]MDE0506645.1 hypothetical protein [Candidatus Poribacteria bacterium]